MAVVVPDHDDAHPVMPINRCRGHTRRRRGGRRMVPVPVPVVVMVMPGHRARCRRKNEREQQAGDAREHSKTQATTIAAAERSLHFRSRLRSARRFRRAVQSSPHSVTIASFSYINGSARVRA
jgi:hypothetical protein